MILSLIIGAVKEAFTITMSVANAQPVKPMLRTPYHSPCNGVPFGIPLSSSFVAAQTVGPPETAISRVWGLNTDFHWVTPQNRECASRIELCKQSLGPLDKPQLCDMSVQCNVPNSQTTTYYNFPPYIQDAINTNPYHTIYPSLVPQSHSCPAIVPVREGAAQKNLLRAASQHAADTSCLSEKS